MALTKQQKEALKASKKKKLKAMSEYNIIRKDGNTDNIQK